MNAADARHQPLPDLEEGSISCPAKKTATQNQFDRFSRAGHCGRPGWFMRRVPSRLER